MNPANDGMIGVISDSMKRITNAIEEAEDESSQCTGQRGMDSRDPAFNPEHDYRYLGDSEDGTSFHQCRNCGHSYES